MCYPKPGPRCSTHAEKRLQLAVERVEEYSGDNEHAKKTLRGRIIQAQKEYYTSPRGIKFLEAKAKESGNPKDAAFAAAAKERRAKMIAAYKEAQAKIDAEEIPSLPEVKITSLQQPFAYGTNMHFYCVDYEYDFNGCTGYTCGTEDGDGYCRDSVYEGLRVSGSIKTREVLAQIFNTREERIPDDLVKLAEDELQLNDPESYDIRGVNGYYGEEVLTTLNNAEHAADVLRTYYNNMPDAKDEDGILPYLRGKGLETTGLTPLEGVKKHLRDENRGIIVDYVERTNHVSKETIDLQDVRIPQQHHYDTVAPRTPLAPKGVEKICGIVVKKNNSYVLVDGYHRMKHELEWEQFAGNFIVLEVK